MDFAQQMPGWWMMPTRRRRPGGLGQGTPGGTRPSRQPRRGGLPNGGFHYTPKHGSWLNMAEIRVQRARSLSRSRVPPPPPCRSAHSFSLLEAAAPPGQLRLGAECHFLNARQVEFPVSRVLPCSTRSAPPCRRNLRAPSSCLGCPAPTRRGINWRFKKPRMPDFQREVGASVAQRSASINLRSKLSLD